jgi:hypothetical protein
MRLVVALLVGTALLAGCDSPVVKNDYMSLDQLKQSKKFLGYDVVLGPGLNGADMKGPYRVTSEVNADIRMETRNPFHRRVKIDGQYYEFKLEEDVIGFGYRLLSVRNQENELGVLVLKTKNKVPSFNINAEGGVLLTEREKKERAEKAQQAKEKREAAKKEKSSDKANDAEGEDEG